VWDARTGEPITPPLRFTGDPRLPSFSKDGRQVRMTGSDGTLWKWHLRSDDRSVTDLQDLARVLAGCRVDPNRGLLPLQSDQLREMWQAVQARKQK
jgi:hypothetical protein